MSLGHPCAKQKLVDLSEPSLTHRLVDQPPQMSMKKQRNQGRSRGELTAPSPQHGDEDVASGELTALGHAGDVDGGGRRVALRLPPL